MKLTDAEVAKYLKTVKLTEKLDDRTIEDWLALGIGPKTRAALEAAARPEQDPVGRQTARARRRLSRRPPAKNRARLSTRSASTR